MEAILVHLSLQELVDNFVTLMVVLNPLSIVPVFLGVTPGMTAGQRRRLASESVLFAAGILLFFAVAGQVLLQSLGIPLYSFQIAGGIVLFMFSLNMIFGQTKSQPAESKGGSEPEGSIAVFPLAIPGIAGPGSIMAIVLLTDNDRFSFMEQLDTVAMLALVLLILWLVLLLANPINRVIGTSGANVVARIMGLILAALAVNSVLKAIAVYLGTLP